MRTIHEDLDDLDRMVDGGASKDKIRSQIRLISREVAALEAGYTRLEQIHLEEVASMAQKFAELEKAHAELVAKHAELEAPKLPPTQNRVGTKKGW